MAFEAKKEGRLMIDAAHSWRLRKMLTAKQDQRNNAKLAKGGVAFPDPKEGQAAVSKKNK